MVLAGCGLNITNENPTPTPDFVTATLPLTQTLQPATTSPSPATLPIVSLIEGTTTTQINVRSEPSTIGNSFGTIAAFSKVQIIGRESNGAWYQIVYSNSPDGKGWVTATYVQVDATAEIPVVETGTTSGLSVNGLVVQPVNVRSGPGTNYESLGTLSPNDVVKVTGKDPGSSWLQIDFKSEAGWVATEFLKVDGIDGLPVTANSTQASTTEEVATLEPSLSPSPQDGDSMQMPSAAVTLSTAGTDAFQFDGNVSSPSGDTEDWLQFKSVGSTVILEVKCSSKTLQVQLWNNNQNIEGEVFSCEQTKELEVKTEETYFLRVLANESNSLHVTRYSLSLKIDR